MSEAGTRLRRWEALSPEEQLALREVYGRHLDDLSPTCDTGTKAQRFRDGLATRGVNWRPR